MFPQIELFLLFQNAKYNIKTVVKTCKNDLSDTILVTKEKEEILRINV